MNVDVVMTLPILLFVIVVAGLVAAFVKSGKTGRVVTVASVLGIVALLGVAMLFTARRRVANELEATVMREHATALQSSQSDVLTGRTFNANDAGFLADVYPSENTAAIALIRDLQRQWNESLVEDKSFEKLYIHVEPSTKKHLENAAMETLRACWPQASLIKVEVLPSATTTMPTHETPKSASLALTSSSDKSVFARFDFPGGTVENSTRVRDASWVVSNFAFDWTGPGEAIRPIRPTQPVASADQAHDEAIAAATEAFTNEVAYRLNGMHITGWNPDDPRHRARLAAMIEKKLRGGEYIRDRFVQRFPRPYGDLYQEGILLSTTPSHFDTLAEVYANELATTQSYQLRKGGAIALLALLIVGLYAFLNAATKGYYTWSLRVATVLMVAGIIFVALTFA